MDGCQYSLQWALSYNINLRLRTTSLLLQVKAWQPYVFIYTQSQDEAAIEQLRPFIQCGGDIVRLANAGRESHVYLQHINRHYEDLADHTLFSQDEPNTYLLPKKFEASTSHWECMSSP